MSDQLQRFVFEDTDIRGELTRLQQSYADTVAGHGYSPAAQRLLGEFLAAATLLSATLKFNGKLALQASSAGPVTLAMVEITSARELRAVLRGNPEHPVGNDATLPELLPDGQLAITLIPDRGQRYQGIVPLEGEHLAQCLEAYFRQSEQLATRIWLHCDEHQAAGMLLQELPAGANRDPEQRQQQWQHVTTLADTLTPGELLALPFTTLLHRLYHRDPVRLFDPQAVSFRCSCSAGRTLDALRSLGEVELRSILEEQGTIDIQCEFCLQQYRFGQAEVDGLFAPTVH